MARKNILAGLMGPLPDATPGAATPVAPEADRPRYAKGAVGAISRSVAELQARALMEIDPNLIEAGGLQDRLEAQSADDEALRQSIAEYGQQVPVLVRPHPTQDGRFQVVYGRRRVLVMRELGRPVKALLRQLDDRDMVIAQGHENNARRDLSFIEKANFARQMEQAGYDRKIIGDTLMMDKTLISRLLSVAERVALEVIHAIGAAPSIGRDRWLALADAIEAGGHKPEELVATIQEAADKASDERFEVALRYARGPRVRPDRPEAQVIHSADGQPLAEVLRSGGRLTIRLGKKVDRGFEEWFVEQLPDLYRQWTNNH